MPTTLITGATGFLGREILRYLLACHEDTVLVPLIRAPDEASLAGRWRELVAALPTAQHGRVIAVRGDITQPCFGLSRASYAGLTDRIDRVIHVAASTRFDHTLAEARRRNVDGTLQVLTFCRALRARGKSGRLDYLSTAYVAGDRRDLVYEEELDAGQGFRNTYERSKLEAEECCRAARSELPIAIYRPSIVVGDSATGRTTSYATLYWPMKVLVRFYDLWRPVLTRLVPLPLRPDCSLDIVPVDYVADTVATLYGRLDAEGRCYHLAAGPDGAATMAQLVSIVCDYVGMRQPRYLNRRALLTFERLVCRLGQPSARGLLHGAALIFPYIAGTPRFDTTNTLAAGVSPPSVAEYFERLVAYAYATDFGGLPADRVTATSPTEAGSPSPVSHLSSAARSRLPAPAALP